MASNVLKNEFSEPLSGATTARIDINSDTGNLTIDRLTGGEPLLARGTLQYLEKRGVPARTLSSSNGQAFLTVKGGGAGSGRSWFRFPWDACGGGAYDWQIHLNPMVTADITAHSGGGNVKLDLAGMAVTRVAADSGGGNMEVVLPDNATNPVVTARTGAGNVTVEIGSGIQGSGLVDASSGAGNVTVYIPSDVAARIQAASGLGKVIMDPRYGKTDKHCYQSAEYDRAANRVEINLKTGAGNVIVSTRVSAAQEVR